MTNGPLTSVADLAGLLESAAVRPVLLDSRWHLAGPPGVDSYRQGHLPDAVFVDLDRDLAAPPGAGGRHPLPDTDAFQASMRAAGVSTGVAVVVYDDGDNMAASRAWWLLRYFGHSQVQVLDGGYRAWVAAGQQVTTAEPAVAPGDFGAVPGHLPLLDAEGAARTARSGLLLDARSAERFRGEAEHVDPVAGHIPGAVSAPTTDNSNPDGTFKDPAELAARFAGLGAKPTAPHEGSDPQPAAPHAASDPQHAPDAQTAPDALTAGLHADAGTTSPTTGVYCGSGVTAAHEVLALALAGVPAALYVGSWSEWITDPVRPVATGA